MTAVRSERSSASRPQYTAQVPRREGTHQGCMPLYTFEMGYEGDSTNDAEVAFFKVKLWEGDDVEK